MSILIDGIDLKDTAGGVVVGMTILDVLDRRALLKFVGGLEYSSSSSGIDSSRVLDRARPNLVEDEVISDGSSAGAW